MASLIGACGFFLGLHIVVSGSPLRGVIVRAIGERTYLALFSLLSLGGIVWMARAYSHAPGTSTWSAPPAARWGALVGTLIAFVFVVVGLTTPSPTVTGGESRLDLDEPAQGAMRVTRHPFLWGVALWAATHVAVNGDTASLVLFGSLLALALIGPLLIDAKRRHVFGSKWVRFAAVTSNVPFAAILTGRNNLRLDEIGAWRIAAGVALWMVMLAAHPWLFSAPALPMSVDQAP
jgi:uncharacterized membrane protein